MRLTRDERVDLRDVVQRLQQPGETVDELVEAILDRLHHIAVERRLHRLYHALRGLTLLQRTRAHLPWRKPS